MKKIYLLFLITTFLYSCKEAKLDHPTEGAGGLLIGVSQEVGNSVLVTNFPTNMNENGTSTIQVKLSQKIETDTILTIT